MRGRGAAVGLFVGQRWGGDGVVTGRHAGQPWGRDWAVRWAAMGRPVGQQRGSNGALCEAAMGQRWDTVGGDMTLGQPWGRRRFPASLPGREVPCPWFWPRRVPPREASGPLHPSAPRV